MTIEQAILEKVRSLPHERQQQVLNFAEFLVQKSQAMTTEERAIAALKTLPPDKQQKALNFIESLQTKLQQSSGQEISVLEVAGDLIGAVEGSGDLSTNPKYMEGFGQ